MWALRGQLPEVLAVAGKVHPRRGLILAATCVTLLSYALLIEGWRRVLIAMGGALQRADAARIWLTATLAKWIPGAFWQLGAMTEMARRRGVPVAVSTGSAMLITIVNVFTGIGVAALFAAPVLRAHFGAKGWLFVGVGALTIALSPFVVPRLGALARRLSGRDITMPHVGVHAVLVATLCTSIAWLAYGVAFWLMALAVLPGESRSLTGCIAVYTLSYLVGLLNPAPGGIGVAEGAILVLAPELGVATHAEAAVLSIIVRLWRTVIEVAPGLIALAIARRDPDEAAVQPSRGSRIP